MVNFPLIVFLFSFAILALAAYIGDFLRKRVPREEARDDFGIVITSTLTLLGLIVGFTFSMSINRYDLRKSCEQAEANAIATQYARADLLAPADALKVRELLAKYIDQRLLFYTTRDQTKVAKINVETAQIQSQSWSAVRSAVAAIPAPLMGLLISGMNDISNSQRSTQASWWNRIPVAAWILVAAVSFCNSFLIGYRARRTDWFLFLVLPVALSISFFLISDIDSPNGGTIRVIPQNLLILAQSM
jgi:hypothetical protein